MECQCMDLSFALHVLASLHECALILYLRIHKSMF